MKYQIIMILLQDFITRVLPWSLKFTFLFYEIYITLAFEMIAISLFMWSYLYFTVALLVLTYEKNGSFEISNKNKRYLIWFRIRDLY